MSRQTYKEALKALATRTKTPLPSLILSFGILHEVTAIIPLVGFFYASRTLGVGQSLVDAVTLNSHESWVRSNLKDWVDEGGQWAGKVGRRYGVFGIEKGPPHTGTAEGETDKMVVPAHIPADIANAIVAYGVTKVLIFFPLRRALMFTNYPGPYTLPNRPLSISISCIFTGGPRTYSEDCHADISTPSAGLDSHSIKKFIVSVVRCNESRH